MSQGWRARNTIGLWRSGEVRSVWHQRGADGALVTVVAVGRADPRDRRVAAGEFIGGHDQGGRQAVTHLIEARKHGAQPGIAAFGMSDDQESGALGLGQLQAGEEAPARGNPPGGGQGSRRHQHRPLFHTVTDLKHRELTATFRPTPRTIRSGRHLQRRHAGAGLDHFCAAPAVPASKLLPARLRRGLAAARRGRSAHRGLLQPLAASIGLTRDAVPPRLLSRRLFTRARGLRLRCAKPAATGDPPG